MKLSIIIPFYNEKDSLPVLLKELAVELTTIEEDFELILVDDGSEENLEFIIHN